MIKVNEIFHSIQGESTFVGNPTLFIRTTGCNLRCHYCDTKYSYYEGSLMSIEDLVREAQQRPHLKYVCITGGEPLLQKEVYPLMSALCDLGYFVSLETSGSKSCREVDGRVKIVLDVKTPASGEGDSFLLENIVGSPLSTEFKFVICSEDDFKWSENFCRQHDLFEKFTVLYSPSFEEVEPQWLAEKILQQNSPARLQLQLHKYIWFPHTRGV
ncbi:MAG: 7-carboxy-7-deazaguanine synthase QueE [Bdellovibrio sp.]|nr:MAG: 7-carboxy-7-deazaguanine synthase QueE [Bdellovibrio sp.]